MTYIGQQPATTFDSGIQDRFTGLSSNTVTLTHEISAETDILVVWNNIVQDSGTYSVGGTGNKTLTLGGTLVSADVVTVYYTNKVMQSVNPTAGSVTSTILGNDILSGQTDIGADIVDADLFLVDDGAGGTVRKSAASRLKTYIGDNTPAFFAHAASTQTGLTDNTYTKATLGTEVYDTDNAFATSRFTVPSGEAGKYFFYASIRPDADSNSDLRNSYLAFYVNGSRYFETRMNYSDNLIRGATNTASITLDLSASDYVELYGATDTDGSARSFAHSDKGTCMGGYKLIGV